jgi:tRNA (mo5U34)-methyltransferase
VAHAAALGQAAPVTEPPAPQLVLDEPTPEIPRLLPLRVAGWSHSPAGIAHLSVYTGGTEYPAELGTQRQDVAAALADPDAADSGWFALLDDLSPGRHDLEVRCTDRAGATSVARREVEILPDPPAGPGETRPGAGEPSPALWREVQRAAWMYRWPLTPRLRTPLISANLLAVHRTRLELMEPPVRAALAAAGPAARVIDLGCNEGWFAHRLLEWGAREVVGIDLRADNVRRAELLREHFGVPADRMTFHQADVLELDPEALGRFDIVLLVGLIYHLERPLDAIRLARALTDRLCIIESQLTRQPNPIEFGYGRADEALQAPASFAAWVEAEPANPLASAGGIMSLVPNQAALLAMPGWAGFARVQALEAQAHHDLQYRTGDRAVVAAWGV